jgi:hypothetical protein
MAASSGCGRKETGGRIFSIDPGLRRRVATDVLRAIRKSQKQITPAEGFVIADDPVKAIAPADKVNRFGLVIADDAMPYMTEDDMVRMRHVWKARLRDRTAARRLSRGAAFWSTSVQRTSTGDTSLDFHP